MGAGECRGWDMRADQSAGGYDGRRTTTRRPRRRGLVAVGVTALVAAALLAPASPAAAVDPVVHVSPTAFWPDTVVAVVAMGLTPGATETVEIGNEAFASGVADGTGTLHADVRIPWDAKEGAATLSVVDPVDGATSAPVTVLTSWPMFRRDPTHQANDVLDTGITETASGGTVQFLHTVWTASLGGRVIGSPVVAGGKVYVGAENKRFEALDASSGNVLWTFVAGGGVYDTAAVLDGIVYVGGGSTLYALDADTGGPLWTFTTGGRLVSSPVVTGGVVYVGSDDHHVYAVDAATGSQRWSATTGGAVESSPAVRAGRVFVGSQDQYVYALDAATGTRDWRHHTGGQVQSSPAVSGSTVYVGSDDAKVYALNASTGAVRWTFQTRLPGFGLTHVHVNGSPAVANGEVLVQTEDDAPGNGSNPPGSGWIFFAINATTGQQVTNTGDFSFLTTAHTSPFTASMAVVNGLVCGTLSAYSSVICDTVQDFALHEGAGFVFTSANMVSSPAVAGEMVFAADVGGTVYAAST